MQIDQTSIARRCYNVIKRRCFNVKIRRPCRHDAKQFTSMLRRPCGHDAKQFTLKRRCESVENANRSDVTIARRFYNAIKRR